MTHPPIHIPVVIEQQAIKTIDAMNARGLKHPCSLTSQCKQIAVVILAKWNIVDTKVQRALTNKMVYHCYDVDGVTTHQCCKP